MPTRRTRTGAHALIVVLTALLAPMVVGCASGDRGGMPVVERIDSAGVLIVETHRPAWTEGGAWSVDAEPELSIGEVEGEAPYLFADVAGAVRLDDGSIVVADGQSREVRFFDSTGAFVRAVGRPGGGPREFPTALSSLARCGADRIYARDVFARRVIEWNARGEFVRSFELLEPGPGAHGGPYHAVCTDDGGFVASGWGDFSTLPTPPPGDGALTYTQMAPVWVLDSVGAVRADLGSFLSSERILTYRGSSARGSGPHPFGRATTFAAAAGKLYLGSGQGVTVSVYDAQGHLTRIQRALTEDLSIDQGVIDAYRAADLSEREERDRKALEEAHFAMPPQLPGYTAMRASPDGHLWIKRFTMPGSTSNRWGVFSPDGVFLGNLQLPEGLDVTEVGDDYVLGVSADSLGVQRVQLRRIRREG